MISAHYTDPVTTPITISTTVQAPIETVWAAYNEPQQVEKWNFASPDWECQNAHSDLRVGGSFGSRMAARDGSMGFDFGGTYTKVDAPRELAYEIGDGRKVTVQFEALGGNKTRLTTQFDPEATNPAEMQQAGWQAILDNFGRYVEGQNGGAR